MNEVRLPNKGDRVPVAREIAPRQLNSGEIDLSRVCTIPRLFEEQAGRTPDRIALIEDRREMTYAALDAKANQLAHYLIESGVTIETPVGLFMPRSIEMVIAILGILKSGAVYQPLDAANPAARLDHMIRNAGTRLLLTLRGLENQLPGSARRIYLDDEEAKIAQQPDQAVEVGLDAENLAYLVYTSGSTGAPKGVELPHRVFARCDSWARNVFQFRPEDRFLLKSVRAPEELFYPVFIGAPAVIAPPDAERDSALFIEAIARSRATVASVSPAFLSCVLNEPNLDQCQSLKSVLCSGEPLSPELRKRFFDRLGADLYNFYGLAEAPYTSIWRCTAKDDPSTVPIGRPVDAKVHLLDANLRAVPAGTIGELYVSGPGLARGYRNLPALTAERFVANPNNGSCFYRTGDLGHYNEDRGLVLHGRTDHQIKVRGFRVEPGEVEAALLRHSAIRDAVVLLRENTSGEPALAAFLVLNGNASITSAGLRIFLKESLPDYAIPSQFPVVAKFPLGPTGKVDRNALAQMTGADLPVSGLRVAPGNQLEQQFAHIWQEVLGGQQPGIDDNFFDLGGHSLLATRVMARVRATLGVDLPLRELFEAPTIRELAQRMVEARQTEMPPLRPVPWTRSSPLSFAQERLWFLDQMEPESSAYHIPEAYLLNGPLDVDALERALQSIVKRHEVLRTHFEVNGTPVQRIDPEHKIAIQRADVSGLDEEEQPAELQRIIANYLGQRFELAAGPVLRVALVGLGHDRHLLLTIIHHIASDDWSMALFFSELSAFYNSSLGQSNANVSRLPVQYADYAIWQRQWLEGPEFSRQLRFWQQELKDAAVLELPADRPRPPQETHSGARHSFTIPAGTTAKLIQFNRQENVTPFMTLLAAFQVLLARYSGQEDIVIGTPITNRHQVELENMMGFFVNTVVLRADLSGKLNFREVVRRARRNALNAYQNQDFPFEELVRALNPQRDLSRHPLFQILFSVENGAGHPPRFQGLDVSLFPIAANSTRFDLELQMSIEGDRCAGFFSYNTDLFDAGRIERMARHYEFLLERMLGNPGQPVWEAPILTAVEQDRLLREWNATRMDYPREKCLHQLFEEQAEAVPESIAVVFGDDALSYRELNQRANLLAHRLRALGARPGTRVGICSEPGLEMLVGLIGILKSGAAYVPLDHHFPPARLALILDDAAVAALVVQKELRTLCSEFRGETIVLGGKGSDEQAGNVFSGVTGEDAAYVIFTSGSTGHPKGVAIRHNAVVNLLLSMRKEIDIRSSDVLLTVTPISFDISVLELFLPLSVGARVVISPDAARRNGEELAALLEKSGTTILQATPATWTLLLQVGWNAPNLRALAGGEALSADLAGKLLDRCGALWNGYGPTETTIYSTVARVEGADVITIGKPIDNTQLYLVDKRMQPVPIGVPGELLIGGAGVATGYLDQPALTAERFVADPFSSEPGKYLYRTGDLCRYRPDGNVEFLERMDHQVKIRGYRVELGEIEAALQEHPAVEQCVVLDRLDHSTGTRLIAYFIPSDRAVLPAANALLEFLKRKLPDYMLPAAFVGMERWPLTGSGKIDRKALPAPSFDRRDSGSAAPRDAIERQLVRIWEGVLGVRGVGTTGNFFELGGHSLLAVKLIAEINRTFGIHLPLRPVFRTPTIEGVANAVRSAEDLKLKPPGLIWPGFREAPHQIYWAPSIGNLERFIESHYLARELRGACDFFGFDPAPGFTDIVSLARHCIRLMRAEQPHGPYSIAGFCQCGHVAHEMARQLESEGEQIRLLVVIDSLARDLGPTLRQNYYWLREGLRGSPREISGRIRSAVRRMPVGNGHSVAAPEVRFAIHAEAARQHKAGRFSGSVVLFRSEELSNKWPHSPKLGWDALARKVEVHTVPSLHSEMLGEQESVRFIAEKLKKYLPSA